jgi:hypothetical protein
VSGRHGDDDSDGVANHIDPDWNESAEVLLGTDDPDVWIGVTRPHDSLPVQEASCPTP